jgi:3-hydroxyacyl-CoA dehydrogenase
MSGELRIESAAVIGAGVMGATISAHLANAGIPNLLLDLKADEPTDEERARGLSLDDAAVASRLAHQGLERARKAKPAAFYTARDAGLVQVGNLEDDLERLREVDWVIEVIVENLDIKRRLFDTIVPHLGEHTLLTSNTSGLSVAALAASLPEPLRPRFLVTHFFNPPRYLKLLEIVRCAETAPAVVEFFARFGEDVLGKGIVYAKDTPNFIANRIGAFAMFHAVRLMVEKGYTIAEVDKLTGKAIGRPRSATFRTADLVGLDTLVHVAANMHDNLPDDPERDLFRPLDFVTRMVEEGWLGEKAGQGFYKKQKVDGQKTILMLDPDSMTYVEQPKVKIGSLEMARSVEDVGERIRGLVGAKDRGGEFLWSNLSASLRYAADRIPEISDDIVNVDNALKWGFGWELGPFQIWDAIGVRRSCERMAADGAEIPAIARALLDTGAESFYQRDAGTTRYFDLGAGEHRDLPANPRVIVLADSKAAGKVVIESPDATLVDLGDEVAGLEFHTKMNTIGPGVIAMMRKAVDEVEKNWRGLVIGNEADNFCVGANLLLVLNEIDDDNWDDVEWMVEQFQGVNQRLRYSQRPVVVAPRGLTLGGGCEVLLGADRVCAAAESYIGLVELGAGLIPAGGGCKEMIKRAHQAVPAGAQIDLFPFVRKVFETIGMARVATSAGEAVELGYLRADDRISIHGDHLIADAKNLVLALDRAGYRPPRPLDDIRVVGEAGLATFRTALHNFAVGGQITEYDGVVGEKLAWVLCGGEVSGASRVSEQYLLELEREAFMSLCGETRTLARMEHILKTGKPLRN